MIFETGDTAANLATYNYVYPPNYKVTELDTGRWKLGNGVSTYTALPYGGVSTTTSTVVTASITTAGGLFLNGTASQLATSLQEYNTMVYLTCTTAGTALAISVGPTSTPANVVTTAATPAAGNMYSVWLPAGWYLKWSATTAAFATQAVHTCL
jgi:hypothetical protein